MPILTVRDGARCVVRRIDGPLALDSLCPSTPRPPYGRGWTLRPEGRGVTLVSPAGIQGGSLVPGEALELGGVKFELSPDDLRSGGAVKTEKLVRDSRAKMVLDLPDGRTMTLGSRAITLGKGSECDVVLSDPTVSQSHCQIVPGHEGWEVRDTGSTNGTRVGGVLVHHGRLAPGTELVLGRTRILCRLHPDEMPATGNDDQGSVLVGDSPAMESVRQCVGRYAMQSYPVLIHGETGAGKEIVARMLHERSGRARGPFVAINAATIAPELVESELFGHERGSFTGAATRRRGVFEEASGGTLFLDEIGESR